MTRSKENILTKSLLLLIAISVAATVSNLYYNQPLLPAIGLSMGIDDMYLGYIPAASQLGYAAAILFISPLGDIMNRRTLITYLSMTLTLGLFSIYLAPNFLTLVIATFIVGLSANITQQLIPLVASLSKVEEKGKNIATVMMGLTIGILLSRTISGTIAEHFSWETVFLSAGFVAVIIGVLLNKALPDNKPSVTLSYGKLLKSMIELIKIHPLLRQSATTGFLAFASFNALWATIAIHVMGDTFSYSVQQAGLLGFVGLAGIAGAKISGKYINTLGANKLITISLVFIIIGFAVMYAFGDSLIGLVLGILLVDLGIFGAQIPNQHRVFSIDPKAQSRLNAVYMLFYYLGAAFGSTIGVKVISSLGWKGLSLFSVILVGLALIYHIVKTK
jgi:predicted MFS family arabinose efflux permease